MEGRQLLGGALLWVVTCLKLRAVLWAAHPVRQQLKL